MIDISSVNWQQVAAVLAILSGLWVAGIWVVEARLKRVFVSSADLSSAVTAIGERVTRIEAEQGNSPSRRDMTEIEGRVERVEHQVTEVQRTVTAVQVGVASLQTGVEAINRELGNLTRSVGRITEHLLRETSHE